MRRPRDNAAANLRAHLTAARREGRSFTEAWPGALERALLDLDDPREREAWRHTLWGLVATWRAACHRFPSHDAEQALAILAERNR